jgi:hypothetical protein
MQSRILLGAALLSGAALAACQSMSGQVSTYNGQTASTQSGSAPQAFVRYVPERVDDIAWENDRIAFRIYGPELETAAPPFSSGIDVWGKAARTPVVNKWYALGEHFYHLDHGEGLDCYKVGAGRGCGGLGIWSAEEKKLYVSHTWQSFKILSAGPAVAKFQVTYAPWRITTPKDKVENAGAPGRKVWQVTTFTLAMVTNFNRIETTLYSNEPGELTVGVGLATHRAKDGVVFKDEATARETYWDKADKDPSDPIDPGYIGTGLIVNPAEFTGFVATEDDNLAILKVTPGKPFVYYAGACRSKGPDFHSAQEWTDYVKAAREKF